MAGEWYQVPQIPGAFVINLGDLMSRWTNNRWVSTPHRVVCPPRDKYGRSRRQSMAYFCNINANHVVTCIETCVSDSNPARYPPINAMEFLLQKHAASTKGTKK
jgi:isopenicillin N synthase-like dioxygenase